jgi:hypothetical protein
MPDNKDPLGILSKDTKPKDPLGILSEDSAKKKYSNTFCGIYNSIKRAFSSNNRNRPNNGANSGDNRWQQPHTIPAVSGLREYTIVAVGCWYIRFGPIYIGCPPKIKR